jgi:hypothetical protein
MKVTVRLSRRGAALARWLSPKTSGGAIYLHTAAPSPELGPEEPRIFKQQSFRPP